MKHRWLPFQVLLLLLLAVATLLLPQVRWPIYGWLRGEAFIRACRQAGGLMRSRQTTIPSKWSDR